MINKIIIADTSCLIAFERINELDLLQKIFTVIITTQEVANEFGKSLPSWITILEVENIQRKKELEHIVDMGEASAIALALETMNSTLVIDEKKGRNLAIQLKIEIMGSLKILLLAKERGIINSVKDIINKLEQANFRFSGLLVKEIIKLAHEE